MPKSVSVAEARNQLTKLLRDAEAGGPIEITRRGKPVAMLVAMEDYRPVTPNPGWLDLVQLWHRDGDWTNSDVDELFARDRAPGRPVDVG